MRELEALASTRSLGLEFIRSLGKRAFSAHPGTEVTAPAHLGRMHPSKCCLRRRTVVANKTVTTISTKQIVITMLPPSPKTVTTI